MAADPAALELGRKIGASAASPRAFYVRPGDPAPPVLHTSGPSPPTLTPPAPYTGPCPFWVVQADCKTKKLYVVAGAQTTADSTFTLAFYVLRGGVSIPLWNGTLGAWTALAEVDLWTGELNLSAGDLLVAQLQPGVSSAPLPALLFALPLDLT